MSIETAQHIQSSPGAEGTERATPAYRPRHLAPDVPTRHPSPAPPLRLVADEDLAAGRPGPDLRPRPTPRASEPLRAVVRRFVGAGSDERPRRIDDDVARRLRTLGPSWRVLHAVPLGDHGTDIDHVLIGPVGVFTVQVKRHPDATVWIDGEVCIVKGVKQPYVRDARAIGQRATELLMIRTAVNLDVAALVVVQGAGRGVVVQAQPDDGRVLVLARERLLPHLRSLTPAVDADTVERIYDAARHRATWQPNTVRWSSDLA